MKNAAQARIESREQQQALAKACRRTYAPAAVDELIRARYNQFVMTWEDCVNVAIQYGLPYTQLMILNDVEWLYREAVLYRIREYIRSRRLGFVVCAQEVRGTVSMVDEHNQPFYDTYTLRTIELRW